MLSSSRFSNLASIAFEPESYYEEKESNGAERGMGLRMGRGGVRERGREMCVYVCGYVWVRVRD